MKLGKNKINLKKAMEDFIDSDSPSATATKIVLALVAGGGLVFVGAALPGILKAVRLLEKTKKYSDKQVQNAVYNLQRRKLIRFVEEKNGKIRAELTLNGEKKALELNIDELRIKPQDKWDKKWRVLIFDIPKGKTHDRARDALRLKIKQLGFYQLQKSVWIHPFPCEEEILFVAESYNVQRFIEILTVDKLLHEDVLKRRFRSLV